MVPKVLIAGIAKPEPFFDFLKNPNDECLTFPDHHQFTATDLSEIKKIAQRKIIITTEKDFVRLKGSLPSEQLFYLPIQSSFLNEPDGEQSLQEQNFNKTIIEYVGASTRNS